MTGVQFLAGAGIFVFTAMSRPALGPIQPPIQWVLGTLSPGIKQLGQAADYSPPYSAEVENAWRDTSTPPCFILVWCLIKHKDNFMFSVRILTRVMY
jgi:hypothetical protein